MGRSPSVEKKYGSRAGEGKFLKRVIHTPQPDILFCELLGSTQSFQLIRSAGPFHDFFTPTSSFCHYHMFKSYLRALKFEKVVYCDEFKFVIR